MFRRTVRTELSQGSGSKKGPSGLIKRVQSLTELDDDGLQHKGFVSLLDDRAIVVRVSGKDTAKVLQGIITKDMGMLDKLGCIHTAFLSLQGKVLFDPLIIQTGNAEGTEIFLDCDQAEAENLKNHISRYRMRADLNIEECEQEQGVMAVVPSTTSNAPLGSLGNTLEKEFGKRFGRVGTKVVLDPRSQQLGYRLIGPKNEMKEFIDEFQGGVDPVLGLNVVDGAIHEQLRMLLAVPQGTKEVHAKCFVMEGNFDIMGSISFDKGCYVGQELVSRVYHTGVVRKRMIPIVLNGNGMSGESKMFSDVKPLYSSDEGMSVDIFDESPIPSEDIEGSMLRLGSKKVGKIVHVNGNVGLALLRLPQLMRGLASKPQPQGIELDTTVEGVTASVINTEWMKRAFLSVLEH